MGRQRKAGTPTGNHTFWVISVLKAGKERWGKAGISCIQMQAGAHYALIIVKLDLQIRSTHHAPTPWHFWSKLSKDKSSSSPWEDGAGMKIREYDPQTPPSPVNILPLHLYAPHNRLAKETQGRSSSPVCLFSHWEQHVLYLNKFSLYFLNVPASSPNPFATKQEPSVHWEQTNR